MKFTSTKITNALAAAAAAAAGSVGFLGAPIAAADDLTTTTIGNEARLTNGNVVQGWTITDLKASTDQIPYPVAGTLWEATATDQAIEGSVTPIVSNLNARAKSGETYRVLFGVATPQGVNPSTLAQGQKTTGKVYFDVVGDTPDSVVYNAGGHDLLVWVQPPPQLPTQRGGGSYSSSSPASSATPRHAGSSPGAPIGAEAVPAPGAALPARQRGHADSGRQPGHPDRGQPGHSGPRHHPDDARPAWNRGCAAAGQRSGGHRAHRKPGHPVARGRARSGRARSPPPGGAPAPAAAGHRQWRPAAPAMPGACTGGSLDDRDRPAPSLIHDQEWLDHHTYSWSRLGPFVGAVDRGEHQLVVVGPRQGGHAVPVTADERAADQLRGCVAAPRPR